MKIDIRVNPTSTAHEFADIELHLPTRQTPHVLDVDFSQILKRAPSVSASALDFLTVAAVVYGVDKAVSRQADARDDWTRDLDVTIPISDPSTWGRVRDDLSECLSFLTGDNWKIRFVQTPRRIDQKRVRKRRYRYLPLIGNTVSLFSGGLDSFVGAVDWLANNADKKLLLVGHHDGAVKGPKSDQLALLHVLRRRFPARVDCLQVRVGLKEKGAEISFRSRSFLFLALAFYAAEKLHPECPIIVPENGAIALNPPLTASRRGACSTRTAHPNFLTQIQAVLNAVGFEHAIGNPYEFLTKGELVSGCQDLAILREAYSATVSCAKSGHTYHWDYRKAKACGRCVPCLLRRAALHAVGLDNERYGYDVVSPDMTADAVASDFRALLAFVKRHPNLHEISRMLMVNGPVPLAEQTDYARVVDRLIAEVTTWLNDKAPSSIKGIAGLVTT